MIRNITVFLILHNQNFEAYMLSFLNKKFKRILFLNNLLNSPIQVKTCLRKIVKVFLNKFYMYFAAIFCKQFLQKL